MSHADLQQTIETAFAEAASVTPDTRGEVREAVETALDLLDTGRTARRREACTDARGKEAWQVNQWLKKAVLLSFRLNAMSADPGRARRLVLVGQGALEVRRAGTRHASAQAGFRAVPNCVVRRSAFIAPERRADAVLRQPRRLCRHRHHGRHLGHGRLLRPDRQERASVGRRRHRRRARAAAGQSDHHRGQLLHRRPLRGGRGRRRGRRAR